ncbi:MAG: hypothetical protein QXT13_10555 [Pyrobaculum sp.]
MSNRRVSTFYNIIEINTRRDFEQLLELLTYIVHVLKEQYDVDKIIERIKSTQRQPAELSL